MDREEIKEHIAKIVRYLANTLLGISILIFVSSLFVNGLETYSDQLLWIQLNSMWSVVVMLMLVENFYLHDKKSKKY